MLRSVIVILCFAAAVPLQAGRRRAAAPPANTISITFVEAPETEASMASSGADAWLDLHSLRKGAARERNIRVRRRFGIRVDRAGDVDWGTAVVTARLQSSDGRSTVRIDGRPLTAAPLVVNRRAPIGAVSYHTLEIVVPPSVPEGPLTASIDWEVTTE